MQESVNPNCSYKMLYMYRVEHTSIVTKLIDFKDGNYRVTYCKLATIC